MCYQYCHQQKLWTKTCQYSTQRGLAGITHISVARNFAKYDATNWALIQYLIKMGVVLVAAIVCDCFSVNYFEQWIYFTLKILYFAYQGNFSPKIIEALTFRVELSRINELHTLS